MTFLSEDPTYLAGSLALVAVALLMALKVTQQGLGAEAKVMRTSGFLARLVLASGPKTHGKTVAPSVLTPVPDRNGEELR